SAQDSSGWTALMYARPEECGEGSCIDHTDLIPILVAAGADANYSSPRGDTALMAAAFNNRFEAALVRAGANVNAQNVNGVSALMILASRAEVGAIEEALKEGANPKLTDVQGRTALDYLQLASCGKNPLRDEAIEPISEEPDCGVLDGDNFKQSKE